LAPTRELAAQIRDEVYELSKGMYMRSVACFGGLSKRRQIEQLKMGPQVVIGTPGRIYDLIDNKFLKVKHMDFFVLDEVDRMLDMGFVDTIQDIWNKINAVKQVMFYSATLPTEVNSLINGFI
jgi:ATP-dependent RNA helicase RhlE